MGKRIPLETNPDVPGIEIDAALVAGAFALDVNVFRQLMNDRRITVLCERGTGEDTGRYRASFYYEGERVRLVVDASGRPVVPPEGGGGA